MLSTVYVVIGHDNRNKQHLIRGYGSETLAVEAAKNRTKEAKEAFAAIEKWSYDYDKLVHEEYYKIRGEGRGSGDKAHAIARKKMGNKPAAPDYLNYTVEEVLLVEAREEVR